MLGIRDTINTYENRSGNECQGLEIFVENFCGATLDRSFTETLTDRGSAFKRHPLASPSAGAWGQSPLDCHSGREDGERTARGGGMPDASEATAKAAQRAPTATAESRTTTARTVTIWKQMFDI